MLSHSRAAIATGALAALLTLTGGAVAMAAPQAASVSEASARHGQEQFHLTSSVATATRQQVEATGVLAADGSAVLLASAGDRRVTRLVFSHGAFRLATEFTYKYVSPPDLTTCAFTELYRGDYQIHPGRGRYIHASGSGTFRTRIRGTLKRVNGNCTSTLASYRLSTWTSGSMGW